MRRVKHEIFAKQELQPFQRVSKLFETTIFLLCYSGKFPRIPAMTADEKSAFHPDLTEEGYTDL